MTAHLYMLYAHCLFQDILVVYPANDVEHTTTASTISLRSLVQIDFSAALKWEKLKQANFKLNGLKRIDESMVKERGGKKGERKGKREGERGGGGEKEREKERGGGRERQ